MLTGCSQKIQTYKYILTILPESEIARAELITSEFDDINQITSDETGIIEMPGQWSIP